MLSRRCVLGGSAALASAAVGSARAAEAIRPAAKEVVNLSGSRWQVHACGAPHSLAVADGRYRFEMRRGERAWFDPPTSERSELCQLGGVPYGRLSRSRFTFQLEPGPVTDRRWLVLFQIHGDDNLHTTPAMALNVLPSPLKEGEILRVDSMHGPTGKPVNRILQAGVPFVRGVPHRVEVDFVGDRGEGEGRVRVVYDGSVLCDFRGSTGVTTAVQPNYLKFGVYAGASPSGEPAPVACTFSDLRFEIV